MKQSEKSFIQLYETYAMDPPAIESELDLERSYQNVLKKAGLERPAPSFCRRTKILLVAVAVLVAGLSIAAAAYSASDAFRGVLEVREGGSGADREEMFGRIGTVGSDTAEDAGIEVTLRAAVCDERQLRILVDLVDTAGGPIALLQPDGTLSDGDIMFRDIQLERVDGDYGGYSASYNILSVEKDRASFLMHFRMKDTQVRGEEFILTLQDIMQWGYQDGTALDMKENDLSGLVTEILAAKLPMLGDFREWTGLLYTETGFAYTFGEDITITNALIDDGSLFLAGRGDPDQLEQLLENVVLKNADGKEIASVGASRGGDDYMWWSMEFEGITSAEDLQGYVWHYGAGEGSHMVVQGRWDLTVRADVENTTVYVEPDLTVDWQGETLTVKQLELSPLSLYMLAGVDEATMKRLYPHDGVYSSWQNGTYKATLVMQDGTTLQVDSPNINATMDGWENPGGEPPQIHMQYSFSSVIDPRQVETILISDGAVAMGE